MPELIEPSVALQQTYLHGWSQFAAEGRGAHDDESALGFEFRRFGDAWNTPQGFAAFVDFLVASGKPETPRPDNWVPQSTFWFVADGEYLGSIRCRHELTEYLLNEGGHIGYDVVPEHRRKGYATAMLCAVLPFAAGLGITQALLTCDEDNVGSRKVIEACGGVYEDTRNAKMRYWVPTAG